VTKIEQRSLPELDDELARALGVETGGVDVLRAEVRRNMEREVAETARNRVREQIFEALYRDNPLEVPRALVEEQIRDLQQQAMQRLGTQDPAQVQTPEARAAFESQARRRVALGLLIGEIVRVQQLKVDRARVEQRLDVVTAQYPDPAAVRRQYLASREAMEQLESAALEDQALDWIVSQAKVSEKTSSFGELTGFGQKAAT
jgi:trigger factor